MHVAVISLLFLTILRRWTLKDERKHNGGVDKSSSNNRFVLRMKSAFLMLKTGPMHTPSTSGSYGRPSDKKLVVLEIFKIR